MSREEQADAGNRRAAGCPEAMSLREALLAAIRELNALNTGQMQALIEGDPDFSRFDLLIHMAGEKKDQAKYALLEHLGLHRCEEV